MMLQIQTNITPSLHGDKCCSYTHQSRIQCLYIINKMTLLIHNKLTVLIYDVFCQFNESKNHIRPENVPYPFANLYISPHLYYILLLSYRTASNLSKKYTTLITILGTRKPHFGNQLQHIHYYFTSKCSRFEPIYMHNNK
jgi:hypothetical protein